MNVLNDANSRVASLVSLPAGWSCVPWPQRICSSKNS